jgi:hypothetical protein
VKITIVQGSIYPVSAVLNSGAEKMRHGLVGAFARGG